MQRDRFKVEPFPDIRIWGERPDDLSARSRVCIATEEIVGPVRNGGIASTYYHLARGLASRGHEVHVLYLKGPHVENETPEHWVKHFATFGVTLHYLELPDRPLWGASPHWQQRYAAAFDWFRRQPPFGIVHTSEWRGGLFYVLMAKAAGLAFQDTLFLVKTSSPHIWNRHYQMQPIQKDDLVVAGFAEQKCVEFADMVIGGSAHLLRFMEHIGYRLPKGRTFTQPNIVDFKEVPVTDLRPPREPGDVIHSQEVTFFGRLEARKGIEIFCNGLDILVARGVTPKKVNFLGKFGDVLASRGGQRVVNYLEEKAAGWPFEVEFVTGLNQPEALSFLCSRDMITVMPSLIENSTMAVYEAIDRKLPFFATAVGGTPELIDPNDHHSALIEPTSSALATRLERALLEGLLIPHGSFSNEANLQTWFEFHAYIAAMQRDGRHRELPGQAADETMRPVRRLALLVLVRDGEALQRFVGEAVLEGIDEVHLIATDAALFAALREAAERLIAGGVSCELAMEVGMAAGEAFNAAVRSCDADAIILSDDLDVLPKAGFADAARTALSHCPDRLFTSFLTNDSGTLFMPMGGDTASHYLSSRAFGPEFVAVTREFLQRLGPVETYDMHSGLVHELVTRAIDRHGSDLIVFAEPLLAWPKGDALWSQRSQNPNYSYMKGKSLIDGASLPMRKVLLATIGKSRAGGFDPARFREASRAEDEPVWLVAADRDRDDETAVRDARVVIALDEARSRILFFARGSGDRIVTVNNRVSEAERLRDSGEGMRRLTLDAMAIPSSWTAPGTYGIKLFLQDDEREFVRFVRVLKLGTTVYSAVSGSQILSAGALERLFEMHKMRSVATGGPFSGLQSTEAFDTLFRSDDDALRLAFGDDVALFDEPSDDAKRSRPSIAGRPAPYGRKALSKLARLDWAKPAADRTSIRAGILPRGQDHFLESEIRGWAWDRERPGESLSVVALCEGRPIAAVVAATTFEQLGVRTPGLERHGFVLPVDTTSLPEDAVVELRVLENRQPIDRGVFQLHASFLVEVHRGSSRPEIVDARPAPRDVNDPETAASTDKRIAGAMSPIDRQEGGVRPLFADFVRKMSRRGGTLGRIADRVLTAEIRRHFDEEFYRRRYPDVAARTDDLFAYFMKTGWREQHDPSAIFSTAAYRATNHDVAEAGINPLAHWVLHGRREGRSGGPRVDDAGESG